MANEVDPSVQDSVQSPANVEQTTTDAAPNVNTSLTSEDEGEGLPSWHYQIPKALQGNEILSKYASNGDALQRLVDLEGKADRTITVPQQDATPEERAAFYKRLGRPESPAGYELTVPKELADSGAIPADYSKQLAERAHAAGLTKAQAQTLFKEDVARAQEILKQQRAARAEQERQWNAQLLDSVGGDEDALQQKVARSRRAFRVMGSPELGELFDKVGISTNPLVVNAFERIAAAVGEDPHYTTSNPAMSRAQRKERVLTSMYPSMNRGSGGE
jgi:hypothetical protein